MALDKTLKKVIASGRTGEEVYEKALEKGVKKPTLFKVPQKNLPYVGDTFLMKHTLYYTKFGVFYRPLLFGHATKKINIEK